MIKLDEYEKTPQKNIIWDDVAAGKEAVLKPENFSFINDKDWRKWRSRQADMLVNFTFDHVKKSELAAFTNKTIKEQIDKPEVNISDERIVVPCEGVKAPAEEPHRTKEIEVQYSPKCFTVINIDPKNLVNITSSVRGAISMFTAVQDEPVEKNIMVYISYEDDEEEVSEDKDEEDLAYKVLKSDIVIFDITKSRKAILSVWNIIRAIGKLMEGNNSGENLLEQYQMKTFILISSLMTWSNTPELSTDPEFKLHENYYGLRQCHESFRPHYLLENEFLKLGVKYRQWLRVLVVGTGLIYGPREADLSPLLELSLSEKSELPVFGTGQNHVPVIHIDDLIRLLNQIIHNFPENYEYVFAVEPEILAQNFIISVLRKSYGSGAQTRIVQCKNCLMYDLTDEDVLKLSANLPVEPSYQKMIDWKIQYRFIQAMPIIARRYFSIRRQFKPPCVVISGPSTRRVKNVANLLNNLLGTVHLTPETIVHCYVDHSGPKDGTQRKWSSVEKSINEYTSLPRGRELIKVLNRIFLLPRVQNNGYILEGFPETFKEAQLLDEILKMISEHDAQSFSDYNFDTNLFPDEYIVLLTNDKDIISEINHAMDEKGAASAEILMSLDDFRLKLSNENYSTEFFAEKNLHPKLFHIGEYETELDCAKSIFEMITSKCKKKRKVGNKYNLTVPKLLNLMLSKEEKYVRCKIKPTNLEPIHSSELKIELNTGWKSNNEKKNVLIKDESDSTEKIDNTENKHQESLHEKLALKFSSVGEKPNVNELNVSDKIFYQTGVFTDKVSKPLKGTEGNVSQCCIKNIKQQGHFIGPSTSKMSAGVSLLIKKKSFEKDRTSCKQKGKHLTVLDDAFPLIEWSAKTKKNLKGAVTGWCRIVLNLPKMGPGIISSPKSASYSNMHSWKSSFTAESDIKSNPNLDTEMLVFDGGDKPINDVESVKNLFRTNPLFKNTDIQLYKYWYLFLDLGDNSDHTIRVFKKENLSEEISFKPCERKRRGSKDIIMENLKRRDSKIPHVEERKSKSIIKYGEIVQKLQRCCGKNQLTEHLSLLNASFVEKDLNLFTGSDVSGIVDTLNLTQSESFEEFKTIKSIEGNDPMSKVNFLSASSGSDAFGGAQLSTDIYIPFDSSSNIDPFNTRRVSEMSNSAKSILKILSTHSSVKKSLSSISRKVRFSAGDENWSVKTFEEKFNSWVEVHLEELKENGCLQNHDPCCNDNGFETCSVYLLKHLLQQVGSDWRNDHLNSLLDPFNHRTKLVNFKDVQAFFEKYWSHFRTHPPKLTLLPSSVMVQIEKNYISDSVRVNQRKNLESLCDEQFQRTDTCVCNLQRDYDGLRGQKEMVSKQEIRESLGARSSFDIFVDSAEKKKYSFAIPLNKQIKQSSTSYIDCRRTSSWDPADEGTIKTRISDKSFIPFWNDSDCK